MHKILKKLKEEFFAILPPTIFFFVALHIVTFIRVLMAKGSHFEPLSTLSIAVAALILGKAVLIADILRSEEHTSELQSQFHLVCRLLLEISRDHPYLHSFPTRRSSDLKLKEEFFAILPPTIFFFVALHIVTFIRVLMAKGSHFEPLSTLSIAVAALILGKAVLIADIL